VGSAGGWQVWCRTGTRIRQFTVAIATEATALASLRADNPDVEIILRHAVAVDTVEQLGMADGETVEWVPLDCKEAVTKTGGASNVTAIRR
jgi:hypothetical protein